MDKLIADIHDVNLIPLKIIKNSMGNIFHGMKKSDIGYNGFEEAYFSSVTHNTIKPWKKHLKMTLNLIVPIGGAIIVNASTKTQWLIEGYICSYNIVGVVDLITMLPLHTRTWSYPHFPTMFFFEHQQKILLPWSQ